jgi:ASPIC and UnbV/FG-GAP-like repeat/Putative metal-binding motif
MNERAWGALLFVALGVQPISCGSDDATSTSSSTGGGSTSSSGGGGVGGQGGDGGTGPSPGGAFDRFCTTGSWDESLEPASPGALGGAYLGVLQDGLPIGSLMTMKVVPEHPMWAKTLRVAFGAGPGSATIRLMTMFGRSYPGGWPDVTEPSANLIDPIVVEVPADADPENWMSLDIADLGVFLEPTQHYVIVVEQSSDGPKVAVEELVDEPASRALMLVPNEAVPFGLGAASFRMELTGDYFCAWTDRWFAVIDTPWQDAPSGAVRIVDLDGDGHDDVVVQTGGPTAYFGDGTGAFSLAPDLFADVAAANLLAFADVDDDGDRDAFAGHYVTPNGDGDAFTLLEGDCNDADPAVHPNASEQANGYDDDCDGVADDGSDTSDADMDGHSIAAGDCDDTNPEAYPNAVELLDARDNDCDLAVDEDFVNRILLNDGSGNFSVVTAPGVETLDPSTAVGFADADQDGDLDVFWGNWLEHYPDFPAVQHRFADGDGSGNFVDATQTSGVQVAIPRPSYGVTWVDFDDDGFQDIFVSNYQLSNNQLWHNQGDGTFLDVAAMLGVDHDAEASTQPNYPGGHSYGASFGDIDLDGDVDLFVPNLAHPRTMPWSDTSQLLLNDGAANGFSFSDAADEWGILYNEGDVNSALADYDNDGDLDLFVGTAYPNHYSILYRNDGAAGFTDVTYETGSASHLSGAVAFVDVDEDGDLDMLTTQAYGPPHVRLFENRVGQDRPSVFLELRGTTSNRDALGARVTLVADGKTQLRDVTGPTALGLQHSHLVHFGLGDATSIDSVTVRWVGGATETFSAVAPNARWLLVEGSGQAVAY